MKIKTNPLLNFDIIKIESTTTVNIIKKRLKSIAIHLILNLIKKTVM